MIAYIFSGAELKFLCGTLGVRGLVKNQFENNFLGAGEYEQALESLSNKGFVSVSGGTVTVNSGVALLIKTLGTASRLFIGNGESKFTAYICPDISLLLIKEINSANFVIYPFENEDALAERLRENGSYEWDEFRLEGN